MSIPRNTPAAAGQDATPVAPAAPAGTHLRRRAVMTANLLAASGLFFFAACADRGLTEPGAQAAAGGPAFTTTTTVTTSSSGSGSGDTARVTLTIYPTTTATFQVNVHKVQIVAGSICDPATSRYGPAYWNTSCTPAASGVKVTAKAWTNSKGHPVVTFSPDLRFVPGKVNTIWLLDKQAAALKLDPLTWCPTGQTTCVNEAATDSQLATSYTWDGYATRRIKHFSGFTVGYGMR